MKDSATQFSGVSGSARRSAGFFTTTCAPADRHRRHVNRAGNTLAAEEIAERIPLRIKTVGTCRENIKDKVELKHYTKLVEGAKLWSREAQK